MRIPFEGLALALMVGTLCGGAGCGSGGSQDTSSGGVSSSTSASVGGSSSSTSSSSGTGTGTGVSTSAGSSGPASSTGAGTSSGTASSSGTSSGGSTSGGLAACSAGCGGAQICDAAYGQCCPAYTAKDLYVDGVLPLEQACCGQDSQQPCGSVTHVMDLLFASSLSGATIHAYNSDNTPDWVPSFGNVQERWPIHLGLGVTLQAPGLYFAPPILGQEAVSIAAFSAQDTAPVTLLGSLASPLNLGAAYAGPNGGNTDIAVNDGDEPDAGHALPLVLSGVAVSGNQVGLDVGPGAGVTFGPLPVAVAGYGSSFTQAQFTDVIGPIGLACRGAAASLKDTNAGGDAGVLSVFGTGTSVYLDDGCQAVLQAGPQLGINSPSQACPTDVEALVRGTASLVFGSPPVPGSAYCAVDADFDLEASNSGQPTVSLEGALVTGGCVGAYVNAGTLQSSLTQYTQNLFGVVVNEGAQSVQLQGDAGVETASVLACNSTQAAPLVSGSIQNCHLLDFAFPGGPSSQIKGANLINLSSTLSVNAENCQWENWADGQTQIWNCNPQFQSCVCSGPACPVTNIPQSLTITSTDPNAPTPNPPHPDAVVLHALVGMQAIDSANGSAYRGSCPTVF